MHLAVRSDRAATPHVPDLAGAAVPGAHHAPVAELRLAGELDVANAARTEEQLAQLVGAGAALVDVDVEDVVFMDLTTLRLLVRTDALLRARGGRLRLRHPPRAVRRLLAVTSTRHLEETRPLPAQR